MKQIKKTENQIVFSSDIEITLANSIRRYFNNIPIMAIEELEISKNDSPLYDETVAHRVGLVPLKAGKGKVSDKIELNVKRQGVVYSGDFTGGPEPVFDKIPLTTLDKGQELKFKATLKKGKGIEHSKFSPGIMFYRNLVSLTVDKEFYDEIKKVCPDNDIKEKGSKIIIKDDVAKEVADVCEGIVNKAGKEAEIEDQGELVVTIESFGQLKTKDIFLEAINVLKSDLKDLSKGLKKI
jgi:DNA-directed RNA polymerase subunit D